jgi:hypothetical protein
MALFTNKADQGLPLLTKSIRVEVPDGWVESSEVLLLSEVDQFTQEIASIHPAFNARKRSAQYYSEKHKWLGTPQHQLAVVASVLRVLQVLCFYKDKSLDLVTALDTEVLEVPNIEFRGKKGLIKTGFSVFPIVGALDYLNKIKNAIGDLEKLIIEFQEKEDKLMPTYFVSISQGANQYAYIGYGLQVLIKQFEEGVRLETLLKCSECGLHFLAIKQGQKFCSHRCAHREGLSLIHISEPTRLM